MIRRIRKEVLRQLPERTDTRIPIEMTPEQVEEHDALNMPIAQLLARSKRRPLTQAEFLKLMMLLTTQRIIANGLAQIRFEEIWPDLSRIERPTETTLKGLSCPKLLELRELIGQIALEQGVGRIYRLCQNRPFDIYILVSEPGIESRISDLVGTKQAFFVGLFDGTSDEVAFERSGSFLSRIERIVAPALERAPARGVDAAEPEDGRAEREID